MKPKQIKKEDMDDIPELSRKLPKWEYKVVTIESELEKNLDRLGSMGWELVNIETRFKGDEKEYVWAVFKRPVWEG